MWKYKSNVYPQQNRYGSPGVCTFRIL
uniref:Uncharacterized protein n=1 Tax=Arundo donax TaxID=35708 RepID=A0A0A9AQ65_ARUDO